MFCPVCGKQCAPDARFCSACGAAAVAPPTEARARVVRPLSPRMIAGVCSGVALYYGWDLVVTRVVLCVFTVLTSGLGILCYIAAWILIPEAPFVVPAVDMTYPAGASAAPPAAQADWTQGSGTGTA